MPVRSIITSPANGTKLAGNVRELNLRGAAWDGDLSIQRVDVSVDYGATWRPAQLQAAKNRYDWRRWTATRARAERGLLRDLDAGDRPARHHAAAHRRQLESARLWRQSDAPGRGAGRVDQDFVMAGLARIYVLFVDGVDPAT